MTAEAGKGNKRQQITGSNMRIIFATHNKNKLIEVREILKDVADSVIAKSELGIDFEPLETGRTFAENSEMKAWGIRNYMLQHGMLEDDDVIMSDDSGLCVNYMLGRPGVYSARFMGEDTSYEIKNRRIIDELKYAEGEERAAHFACDICAAFADGRILHAEGIFEGLIAYEPKGENGFGYDPILYLPEYGKTSAEISPEEKNKISHRGKALRKMSELLKKMIAPDGHVRMPGEEVGSYEPPFQRILIASDSHRKNDTIHKVLSREGLIDMLIFTGDAEGDEGLIAQYAGDGVKCYFVQGNNDFFNVLPTEQELTIGNHKAFITHGHYYGVSYELTTLANEAKARGCDLAIFGHTHRPCMKVVDGVTCLNPGSISFPRQLDRRPSYMIIEVDKDGELSFHQKYVTEDIR